MKTRLTPIAALLALHAAPAMAMEIHTLDSIVVTATRPITDPAMLFRLDDEDIAGRRAATSDSASLLRDIPGVTLYGAGGVSSLPAIHGLADDRLRIKVDGMDLIAACPNHMNSPLSHIDPSAVENVKVYAGVSPVSVGGDSIGGGIVVESAPAAFAKPGEGRLLKGEAGTFYRSNGDARGANLAVTLASENVSLGYTGAYAEADNYQAGDNFKTYTFTGRPGHTLARDEAGSTAYESLNQALNLAWKNDDHLFDFKYGRQHIPDENYPNQRMDMTDNVSDQFNLAYTGKQDWGTLKARAYYEHTEHEMDFGDDKRYWYGAASGGNNPPGGNATPCAPIGPNCAAGMPMYTDGKNTGLTLAADIRLARGDILRVGGEYQAYRLDDWWTPSGSMMWPGTFWNINDGRRDRYALFGEWETRKDRWTHILGLRHETVDMDSGDARGYKTNLAGAPMPGTDVGNQIAESTAFNARSHDKTDHNWDLSWLARYVPDTTRGLEIGLAQKTRSPNLYERYTWSTWQMAALMNNFVGDGNGYVGNLNLKPETARTLSLSADWHDAAKEKWGLKLTPYYTHVKDYIDARRVTNNANQFNVLQYANQSARLYGIDLSGHALVARATGYGDFTVKGLMSYTRGKNRDTDDNLYNIMPLNAKLALAQRLGAWRNTLEGEFVARKEDVSSVRNEMETPGYGLIHLRSRYEQKTWSVDFGIENLFDRLYYLPLGGAYVGQGTTMTNPPLPNYPQWGTPVPGPGRSLYVGLNVKF
ncbi:MAG: TonB-dependent receptor [Hydrogenophilales bacterium]|nr:TonB-dependent receptor [Hydrogenophilales bacterium]